MLEETFFRGVLLLNLVTRFHVAPWGAILISGAAFLIQQLVQVKTLHQAAVITAGCVAISWIGGLSVIASGSFVPAALCHAAFVIFYVSFDNR